jgi:hypothetical protein
MKDILKGSGSCLCGASEIEAEEIKSQVEACHCSMCRKWGGGPLMAIDCGTKVLLRGEGVAVYDSSDWAERGFCKNCGTHLFYRLKETQQYIVPAGLLNIDSESLTFVHQIFIDEKPSYYHFANETKNMTGEEVFAKYAPPEE